MSTKVPKFTPFFYLLKPILVNIQILNVIHLFKLSSANCFQNSPPVLNAPAEIMELTKALPVYIILKFPVCHAFAHGCMIALSFNP